MKKVIAGTVVKISGEKTIKVLSVRSKKHPKYLKAIKISKCFLAHDEKCLCKVGDNVRIIECRPLSKKKRFLVIYD